MSATRFSNVVLFSVCQALAFSVTPMLMFIGSIIGAELAADPRYATLPIAAMVVGTAVGTAPIALAMRRLGRKTVFVVIGIVGTLASAGIGEAIALQSFEIYCATVFLLGLCLAGVQQFRFAAMESVDNRRMPLAASLVLLGGIVAAVVGPELASLGKNITAIPYQGSFRFAAFGFAASAILLLLFYSPIPLQHTHHKQRDRALGQIIRQPAFVLAVASGAIGYAIMTFIMTATPISMHHHHGHNLADTKWVIQSHIAAMFLPSLITPWLIARFGIPRLIFIGLCAYFVCGLIAFLDQQVWSFWSALVLLGIGWNFLFVAGTSLLPSTYHASEQFAAQAVNDVTVFSIQAVAAIGSGWVISRFGWQYLLLCCLPLCALLALLLWRHKQSVTQPTAIKKAA